MAVNWIAAGCQAKHNRLLEVRCGLCAAALNLVGRPQTVSGQLLPAGRLHRMAHGSGGHRRCAGAQRGAPLTHGGNGRTSEHGTGAEQDARARQNGAPIFHRADVAPTLRGRTAPPEMNVISFRTVLTHL